MSRSACVAETSDLNLQLDFIDQLFILWLECDSSKALSSAMPWAGGGETDRWPFELRNFAAGHFRWKSLQQQWEFLSCSSERKGNIVQKLSMKAIRPLDQ